MLAVNLTVPVGTNFSILTGRSTLATVRSVGIDIHTSTAAVGGSASTVRLTGSLGADFFVLAGVVTLTTMFGIRLNVNTRVGALCLVRGTVENTLPFVTDFVGLGSALVAASPTVRCAGLCIHTGLVTDFLTVGAIKDTLAPIALFALFAFGPTGTTVST